MSRKIIRISKILLAFREDAARLKEEAETSGEKTVIIDFSEVQFMSRAFTDEFIVVSEKLKKNGIKIRLFNLLPDLRKLLHNVNKTRKKIRKELAGHR